MLQSSYAILAILLLFFWVPHGTDTDTQEVRISVHDSQVTEKHDLDTYPPESMGYSSSLMRSKDFQRRLHIRKDKKNHAFDNPGEFFRFHTEMRTRSTEDTPSYPPNYRIAEFTGARAAFRGGERLNWVDRGPANVSGRTRAIVVDPDDETFDTWFAGSVAGGIWKTTDAGETWTNKTPDLPNLSIATMVMAPSNHSILYAGTGEGFYNIDAVRGDGILKSTDGGETWVQLENTIAFSAVNRIIVDPQDEDIVLAAVQVNINEFNTGPFARIYKSVDGGDSWYSVYDEPFNNRIQDLVPDPADFNVQYASVNSQGVVKSTDAGENWEFVLHISGTGGGRLELAVALSDPDVVYATLDRTGVWSRLYHSEDAGETWAFFANQGVTVPNWLGSQGWYDNAIAVNPFDPDDVYLGGINLWRKTVFTAGITDVELNNTESFMELYPWGGFEGGGVGTGMQFAAALQAPVMPYGLTDDDYTSVEVRFGPGIEQNGHRIGWVGSMEDEPEYIDYVSVPFQIWDIDTNQQLMVSFFDVDGSGEYEIEEVTDPFNPPLCFIMIHAIPYDDTVPDLNIAGDYLGFFYKNTYAVWPVLPTGGTWDPDALPESDITILSGDLPEPVIGFTQISSGYDPIGDFGTHVDHHNITIIPMDEEAETFRIINGNDGGVYYSDDEGITWENTLNGYNTTQFYGVDKKPGMDEYIGGMQDNGTWQSPPREVADASSEWLFRIGGDGYEASWHYEDPLKIVAGFQFNGLFRSLDGGESWLYIGDQVDNGGGNAPFVTKVAKTNSDPDLICTVGISGVWRSDDFGESWILAPRPNNQVGMTSMAQVKFSLANPQIVWTGSRMNDPNWANAGIHVSTDGALSFSQKPGYTGAGPLGTISGLATHPIDEETAYVMFSFADAPKIIRTTDLGQTWEDITGFGTGDESTNGFPDVATYCLLVMPHDPDIIWAGTEIGLFESTDNGVTWHYADNGLPAVSLWQLNITDDQVVAATHGLGIWTVDIPGLPSPPTVTRPPRLNSLNQGPDGFLKIDGDLRSPYDSTRVRVNDQTFTTLPANDSPGHMVVDYPVTLPMTVQVQLVAFVNGRSYKSPVKSQTVVPYLDPQEGYTNTFNEGSNDFYGEGFQISTPPGFNNAAIHSTHPYPDSGELTYSLQVPIIVADSDAFVRFNEIVIVEPGEPGTEFGDEQFWDYVIVEGTSDGISWEPLLDGYDSRVDPTWLNAYNGGQNGSADMYRQRTIDLHETYEADETIIIRFRLWADEYITGWGWAIDNLEIQAELDADDDSPTVPTELVLAQNYPNPFKQNTTIVFAIPDAGRVSLQMYDLAGRRVATLIDDTMEPGNYEITWSPQDMASGTYLCRLLSGSAERSIQVVIVK